MRRLHLGITQRTFLVAIVAGLIAAPGLVAPLDGPSVYDGGITSSAGTFILHGQLPYRDFWLLYGPLAGYLSALLTAIFGNDVFVLRVAGLALVMVAAATGYRLVADVAPGIRGGFAAVIAATIPASFLGLDLAPWALSMTLALLAINVARSRGPRSVLLAGGIVGLTALARLDVGAYALIAVMAQTRSLRPVAGAAAVFAPVALVFVLLVPISALAEQLIWYPLVGPQAFRKLPGPTLIGIVTGDDPLSWLMYFLPVFAILGAIARWLRTRSIPMAFVGLAVLTAMFRLQTVGRADIFHAAQALAPGLLLIAYLVGAPSTTVRRISMALAGSVLSAIVALPFLALSGPPSPYDAALMKAAEIVDERTGPDEPIFVGEIANTRAFENPMVIYFLAHRAAGVRDTMYNPGVTTTAATQTRMAGDLESRHVRYLILDVHFAGCYEEANDSRFAGSGILDATIARDYTMVADLGAIVVMASRGIDAAVEPGSIHVDPEIPRTQGSVTCPAVVPAP